MFITKWTKQEDEFLKAHFENGEMNFILKNLSRRSESAIRKRASGLSLHRRKNDILDNNQLIVKNQNKQAQLIINKLEVLYADIDTINILSPEYEEYISKIDILEIKLLSIK